MCNRLATYLVARGHKCYRLMIDLNTNLQADYTKMYNSFRSFKYDCAIMCNMFRNDYQDIIPSEVKVITWLQDMCTSTMNPDNKNSFNDSNDIIFGYTQHCKDIGFNKDRMFEFIMPMVFDHVQAPIEEPKCDFIFVGNKGNYVEKRIKPLIIPRYPHIDVEKLHLFIARLFQYYDAGNIISSVSELRIFSEGYFDNIQFKSPQDEYNFWDILMFWYINDAVCRQSILKWIVDSGRELTIVGDGWQCNKVFSKHALGFYTEPKNIQNFYSAHKFPLHINSMGCFHSRPFDILCSERVPCVYSKTPNQEPRKEFDVRHWFNTQDIFILKTLDTILNTVDKKKYDDDVQTINYLRDFRQFSNIFTSKRELLELK